MLIKNQWHDRWFMPAWQVCITDIVDDGVACMEAALIARVHYLVSANVAWMAVYVEYLTHGRVLNTTDWRPWGSETTDGHCHMSCRECRFFKRGERNDPQVPKGSAGHCTYLSDKNGLVQSVNSYQYFQS